MFIVMPNNPKNPEGFWNRRSIDISSLRDWGASHNLVKTHKAAIPVRANGSCSVTLSSTTLYWRADGVLTFLDAGKY